MRAPASRAGAGPERPVRAPPPAPRGTSPRKAARRRVTVPAWTGSIGQRGCPALTLLAFHRDPASEGSWRRARPESTCRAVDGRPSPAARRLRTGWRTTSASGRRGEPKISCAERPSTASTASAPATSRGPSTGCHRYASASARIEIEYFSEVGLRPSPASWGKTYHIQWDLFRPALISAIAIS